MAHLLTPPSHSTAEPEALRVAQQPPVVQGAPLGHRLAGLAAQIRMELAVAVAAAMQQEQTLLVTSQVPVVQAEALGLVVEEEREALEAQQTLTRQAMGPLARSVRSASGPGREASTMDRIAELKQRVATLERQLSYQSNTPNEIRYCPGGPHGGGGVEAVGDVPAWSW